MPVRARPLSPHLQIYRWQVGSTLSILHRITGLALALGFLALTYWLVALAGEPLRIPRPRGSLPAPSPAPPWSVGRLRFSIIC